MHEIDFDFFEKVLFLQALKKDSPIFLSCVEFLDKSLFKNKEIGAIIEIIRQFYLDNSSLPTLTELKVRVATAQLKNELEKAVSAVRGIESDLSEPELIRNAEAFIKQRRMNQLLEKTIEEKAEKRIVDLDSFQKEAEKIHHISLIQNIGLDYFNEIEKISDFVQQKDNVFSSGYPVFDQAIGGGFFCEGKQFVCVGGETNVGKSIVLANIIVNVLKQNKNVVLYTLEMSEMRYARRISSILTAIALQELGERVQDFKQKVEEIRNLISSRLIIKEFPTKAASAKTILAHATMLERQKGFKPHLIAFDYHLLLRASVNLGTKKHEEMQYITQECRALTYLLGAPGISVAQLNRGSHKKDSPDLSNVAGSWDMLSDLDAHVNIWQNDDDRQSNIIRFCGEKARDGKKGVAHWFNIDYDTLILTEEPSAELDVVNRNTNPLLFASMDQLLTED